jgi:hypothetical protein
MPVEELGLPDASGFSAATFPSRSSMCWSRAKLWRVTPCSGIPPPRTDPWRRNLSFFLSAARGHLPNWPERLIPVQRDAITGVNLLPTRSFGKEEAASRAALVIAISEGDWLLVVHATHSTHATHPSAARYTAHRFLPGSFGDHRFGGD